MAGQPGEGAFFDIGPAQRANKRSRLTAEGLLQAEADRKAALIRQEKADRQGGTLSLIRSDPALSGAFAGEAARTPAAQGLLASLTSTDPAARDIGAATVGTIQEQSLLNNPDLQRQGRISQQQQRLQFGQETQERFLKNEKNRFELGQARGAAVNMGLTGFKNPVEAIEFANTANQFKTSIDSMSKVIKVREGAGNLSPLEIQANPELAAVVRNFEQLDSVAMFKKIIDDPRTSDQDREWYRNVIEHGFWDTLTRGENSVELNQLREFRERMRRGRDILQISNPAGAAGFPHLFSEVDLDANWGQPYRNQNNTSPPDFQPVGPFPGL